VSYFVHCDATPCKKRAICRFVDDQPEPPETWHTFKLEGWAAHACCSECFERLKTVATEEPTPSTGSSRLP
jgi:hypothetical protein